MNSIKDVPEWLDSEFADASPREFLTDADLKKIRIGMSAVTVRNRVGQANLSDRDQADRWDYVVKRGDGPTAEYLPYGVYFKDGKVVKVAPLEPPPAPVADAPPPAPAPEPVVAAAAPATEMPAPASATGDLDESAAVNDMVNSWASAWASKDVNAYLGFYDAGFKPTGMGKSAWEKQRRNRLSQPETISLTLNDVQISVKSATEAEVMFKQSYSSNLYKDDGNKTLKLTKASGSWKIKQELFAK